MSIVAILDGAERKVQREKGDVRWCPWCGTSHFKSSADCPNCRAVYRVPEPTHLYVSPEDVDTARAVILAGVESLIEQPVPTLEEQYPAFGSVKEPKQPKSKPKKKRR